MEWSSDGSAVSPHNHYLSEFTACRFFFLKKDTENVSWCWLSPFPHIVKPKVRAFKQLNALSLMLLLKACGHSSSSNFEKMTRLHPNNNRIPLFMLATPTAFCSLQDSPRRCNCLTSFLLNNLIKQKKKCQLLPTPEKQSCAGKRGRLH